MSEVKKSASKARVKSAKKATGTGKKPVAKKSAKNQVMAQDMPPATVA